ncbi:Druantia anti-phage system protein DruA, partial [Candidatus Magnetobacterium casense]
MELEIKYRGKIATDQDIALINRMISENPVIGRRALSQELCRAWNWVQPNGALRDMVCRGFLLALERAGYIKLPPPKSTPPNPFLHRRRPEKIEVDQTPLCTTVSDLKPIEIKQVRRTPSERVYNSLIAHYHYLGYCQPVGEHLKYIVLAKDRPIACFAFSSAVRHIGCRDKFIGWSALGRQKNLSLIAYNTRFLILP